MNYTKFLFITFIFVLTSCEFGGNAEKKPTENETKKEETTTKTPEKTDNWLVIPGQQVGRIQADFNREDIYKMFGEENVAETEIGLGEGETKMGLLVFPKTKNELQVLFQGNQQMEKLDRIKIQRENAMWKTASGVKVGTSLEELIQMNGKDFQFYGFEWDYAGRLASWQEGKLSDQLIVFLDPTNMEPAMQMVGDQAFSSSNPDAKKADLKVISFEVTF